MKNPYLKPGRLAVVIASITALGTYKFYKLDIRSWAERISGDAEKDDEFKVGDYDLLLKMQEREGRALSSLATRMRMTQQTQYDKSKKRGSGAVKKPWES